MASTQLFELHLDFQNYWHAGSGHSSGYHLDALCQKDAAGLPYVSGRQLKGLLRHAVRRAEAWGWYDSAKEALGLVGVTMVETTLFGSASQEDSRFSGHPGMIFIGDAQLPAQEHAWLSEPAQVLLVKQLYVDMYNTAIDRDTGTVVKHSLRGTELALPVNLLAQVSFHPTALQPDILAQQQRFIHEDVCEDLIVPALSLVDLCGSHRSRGLGEVVVSLKRAQG